MQLQLQNIRNKNDSNPKYREIEAIELEDPVKKVKPAKPKALTRFRNLFRKSKDKKKDAKGGNVYFSICDIPPLPTNGDYDKYGLFRYLDDVSFAMDFEMDSYNLLTDVDDDHFNFLVDSVDLKLRDDLGQSILHLAAQYLDKGHIEKLVNSGCDIDAEDDHGYTPYFYAVMANNLKNMHVLKQQNCNYTYELKASGRHAIHIAAQYGAMEALKKLVEMGMSMDMEDSEGLTPVIIASYYGKSELCAYLIENGAQSNTVDKQGIMGLMRIAATMPTLSREVLDTFVEEDIYQGERSFHLNRLLGDTPDTKTSFFHYVIWINNLGILEHSTMERLVEAKWDSFASAKANKEFFILFVLLMFWTILYLQPYSNVYIINYATDSCYILVGVGATLMHTLRIFYNVRMLRQRSAYMEFLNTLFSETHKHECDLLHFKECTDYKEVLDHKFGKKRISFAQDLKQSPLVLLDFIVDILLTTILITNITIFAIDFGPATLITLNNTAENSTLSYVDVYKEEMHGITVWLDLYGSLVICTMWASGFTKLAITENGSFVIYMATVGKDLAKVGTIFCFVLVPAITALFKTVYEAHSGLPWYEVIFVVTRMVIVDYDYDVGIEATHLYPIWWMIVSLIWIFLGSIVILNILIAVMAESYADIMEKTGPLMACMERARCIARIERGMSEDALQKQFEEINEECSPEIVTFDPVTDRETIDIVKEDILFLKSKFNKTDEKLDQRFKAIEDKLEDIRQVLELYTSGGGGGAY